jgi:hypothetical protein
VHLGFRQVTLTTEQLTFQRNIDAVLIYSHIVSSITTIFLIPLKRLCTFVQKPSKFNENGSLKYQACLRKSLIEKILFGFLSGGRQLCHEVLRFDGLEPAFKLND